MNEPLDPLEAELRALAPQRPSQELRKRIADRLTPVVPMRSGGWLWAAKPTTTGLTLAGGGLIAAALALAFLLPRNSDRPVERDISIDLPGPTLVSAFDDTLPTLWQYRSALNRSVNELDALLDKRTGIAGEAGSQPAPLRSFGAFHTTINNFPGEL